MTGYARAAGAVAGVGYAVEIKSVNARGLDIRMRLATGLDAVESEIRRRVGLVISRGSITVSVNLDRSATLGEVSVNQRALATVLAALADLGTRIDARKPSLDGILGLKGVLEQRETELPTGAEEALQAAVLASADVCLADLVRARQSEGMRLAAVLTERIEEIAGLRQRAETHPSRTRDAIEVRLRQQLADLGIAGVTVSEERLAQEAVLLATKADIREELDRLTAHLAAARQLLGAGGPAGRKLDFLSQEFNREANTLCAKANAVDLTAIGLDLKAAIDQFREQVQNIE
ncbi:MAG: YicC [Devosia sp.]|nr:YicC [Devosia sp.]